MRPVRQLCSGLAVCGDYDPFPEKAIESHFGIDIAIRQLPDIDRIGASVLDRVEIENLVTVRQPPTSPNHFFEFLSDLFLPVKGDVTSCTVDHI